MTANAWSTKPSWMQKLWQDLQPAPGRLSSALRIVLASVLALILLLVLQMPFISIGLYFIFLIGRDSPSVSLRSCSELLSVCLSQPSYSASLIR